MEPQIDPVPEAACVGDAVPLQARNCAGDPQWQQINGPGTAVFSAPTATSTTVTVDQPGVYTLGIECTEDFDPVPPCAGFPLDGDYLDGVCDPAAPSWVKWSVISPSPSAVTIYQSGQPQTYFYAPVAGTYNFELKCYYYAMLPGIVAPPVLPEPPQPGNFNTLEDPILDCPMAVVAGSPIQVIARGCENAETVLWTITGTATGGTTNPTSQLGLTAGTNTADTGTETITVVCVMPDGSTKTATCDVEILPFTPGETVACSTSVYTVQLNNCGVACNSTPVQLVFHDCAAENCQQAYIVVTVTEEC